MAKDDSIPSAGTNADSNSKAENILEASNDTKPNVVGRTSLSDEFVKQEFFRSGKMLYSNRSEVLPLLDGCASPQQ